MTTTTPLEETNKITREQRQIIEVKLTALETELASLKLELMNIIINRDLIVRK